MEHIISHPSHDKRSFDIRTPYKAEPPLFRRWIPFQSHQKFMNLAHESKISQPLLTPKPEVIFFEHRIKG